MLPSFKRKNLFPLFLSSSLNRASGRLFRFYLLGAPVLPSTGKQDGCPDGPGTQDDGRLRAKYFAMRRDTTKILRFVRRARALSF